MKSLVITLDQMSLNVWGCYGNFDEWTPQLDSWSVNSFVFDQALATDISDGNRAACWQSAKLNQTEEANMDKTVPVITSWTEHFRTHNIRTFFYGEKDSSISDWASQYFDEAKIFSGEKKANTQIGSTSISQLVNQAGVKLEELADSQDNNWLVWLGLEGVPHPWIVPEQWLEMIGESLIMEEEENDGTESESESNVTELNPAEYLEQLFDRYFRHREPLSKDEKELLIQIYSAYSCMIDHHIGKVLNKVNELFGEEVMVIVTASQGDLLFIEKELKENKTCERIQEGFSESAFKVPFVIQLPVSKEKLDQANLQQCYSGRSLELVQSVDLVPTLFDWFQIPIPDNFAGKSLLPLISEGELLDREFLIIHGRDDFAAFRTSEYIFYWNKNTDSHQELLETAEMYARPEDMHDVNDIITQVPEIAEEYLQIIEAVRN
jgi:arylsulfatase A-like enzyme